MNQGEENSVPEDAGNLGPEAGEEVSLGTQSDVGEGIGEETPENPEKPGKKTLRKPVDWDAVKRRKNAPPSPSEESAAGRPSLTNDQQEGSATSHDPQNDDEDSVSGEGDVGEPRETGKAITRRGKKARHNWGLIATEFIEGIPNDENDERQFLNLRELAERHGPTYQAVRARASKEGWTEKKEAHAIQVIRERQKARTKTLVTKAIDFDDDSLKAAELGMRLITIRLGEVAQEVQRRQSIRKQALEDMENGIALKDKSDLYSAVNYREIEGLGNALSRFQEIGRRALGTDVQQHEISGPGGEPIAVQAQMNVQAEIMRDDPDRIAAILSSLQDAGLIEEGVIDAMIEDDEIVDEGE